MKKSFAIIITIIAISNALELPKSLKVCRRSDPEYSKCLSEVIVPFISSLSAGNRALGIPPLEPLIVEKMIIGEDNSAVSLKQEYRNIKLLGMSQGLKASKYKWDMANQILSSETYNPKVEFLADYEIKGQVLVLPINGKGQSNITMSDLWSTHKIYFEKINKNGETYYAVKNYKINFRPDDVSLEFSNLANGDKALGEQLQNFVKQNSKIIFGELHTNYEDSFGLVFKEIANQLLLKYPMKTLFPE